MSRQLALTARWLSLEEAGRRSGQHVGHLRRRAANWLAEGKSRIVEGSGTRWRYEVREDADPAFGRGAAHEYRTRPLTAVPATPTRAPSSRNGLKH